MVRQPAESLPLAARSCARDVSVRVRAASRWWRSGATQRAIRQAISDLFESCGRIARKTHMPTQKGMLGFFGNQVLINTVAWTAGVMAASLVENFFEARGFRNLWGLTASGNRTLVSVDDYRVIITLASYSAGLVMLILMRHFILRLLTEFRSLRLERVRGDRACDSATSEREGSARSSAEVPG